MNDAEMDRGSEGEPLKRVGGKLVHKGPIASVRMDTFEYPDGSTSTRQVVVHPGSVAIRPACWSRACAPSDPAPEGVQRRGRCLARGDRSGLDEGRVASWWDRGTARLQVILPDRVVNPRAGAKTFDATPL